MNDRRSTGGEGDSSHSGPETGRPVPAPVAVDIGIVAAMPIEVGFLVDRFSKVRKYSGPRHTIIEGEVGGKLIALIIAGIGREAARRGAQLLYEGHHPRWIVSAGFAGALDPDLARHAIVMPNE